MFRKTCTIPRTCASPPGQPIGICGLPSLSTNAGFGVSLLENFEAPIVAR